MFKKIEQIKLNKNYLQFSLLTGSAIRLTTMPFPLLLSSQSHIDVFSSQREADCCFQATRHGCQSHVSLCSLCAAHKTFSIIHMQIITMVKRSALKH